MRGTDSELNEWQFSSFNPIGTTQPSYLFVRNEVHRLYTDFWPTSDMIQTDTHKYYLRWCKVSVSKGSQSSHLHSTRITTHVLQFLTYTESRKRTGQRSTTVPFGHLSITSHKPRRLLYYGDLPSLPLFRTHPHLGRGHSCPSSLTFSSEKSSFV